MRIKVNGVRIFFEVIGSKFAIDGARMREKPTLILLHGGPGFDHSSFRPTFDHLANIAQVVMVDQRGNGRSESGDREGWTLAQWGDDIRAFCDALDIESPIVLGNSFGGIVAISYATRHPGHPGKLILSSALARGSDHYFDASVAMFTRLGGEEVGQLAASFLRGPVTPQLLSQWNRKAFPVYTQSPSVFTDREALARTIFNRDLGRFFIGAEMRSFDMLTDLTKLRCPTLVLAGELDPICPIEAADDIARAVPRAILTYRRYPKCGHGAYRDVPEAFDDIRRFVEATALVSNEQ